MVRFISLIVILLLSSKIQPCFALSVETHEAINEYITSNTLNGFTLSDYLNNSLGFTKGKDEVINSQTVYKWFRDGGRYEDKPPWIPPYVRSTNHFHDPLAPTLNAAGFTGIWDTYFLAGLSAIWWSQLNIGRQTIEVPFSGSYSWFDTRDYFYKALTSTDQSARNRNFADTFRGLGQLMHLVEDMSVPEHARNDGHYSDAYEEWVMGKPDLVATLMQTPIFFNAISLVQPSVFGAQAPVPIANLFDTNQYNGTNPAVTLNQNIGLAEYTNANFVSPDTLFRNYSYPSKSTSVTIEDRNISDVLNPGNYVQRKYYIKTADGETNNGLGYRLAGVDYFWFYRENNNQLHPEIQSIPPMDDYVYEDYAKQLLPRAVGYSAGLLNYFFRGTIEISLPDDAVYSITGPGGTFNKIKLKSRNTTASGEEMTGGTIQLVVKYKTALTDPFHNFTDCVETSSDFSYLVAPEANGITSLSTSTTTLTFNLSPGIPLEATDVYLQVIYKGQLGNEADAVAVGFKDISEPSPVDIANDKDYECKNGENVPVYNPETLMNIYLAFTPAQYASPTNYSAKFASIPPGYYGRVYLLTDHEYALSDNRNGYSPSTIYSDQGAMIQTDIIDGIAQCSYPVFPEDYFTMRGLVTKSYLYYYNAADPGCPQIAAPTTGPVTVEIP